MIKKQGKTKSSQLVEEAKKKFKHYHLESEGVQELSRHEKWMIFEFCEFNMIHTKLIINFTKKVYLRKLLKDIVTTPKSAYAYLYQLISAHEADIAEMQRIEIEEARIKEEELLAKEKEELIDTRLLEPGPIMFLPSNLIYEIAQYLDPHTLFKFSFTNTFFRDLIVKQGDRRLFKKFSMALYRDIPALPLTTVFEQLQSIMEENPSQFNPNLRLRVSQEPRKVAWNCYFEEQPVHLLYKTPMKYYKQFENYYRMFMEAPRVHFGGYYVCKEAYLKMGEKKLQNDITPLIQVTYYRYFRFFPDGRFNFVLSNKKLSTEKIKKLLAVNSEEDYGMYLNVNDGQYFQQGADIQKTNRFGEYVLKENTVHLRFNSATTIFAYAMKIASSSYGAHDSMIVTNQSMFEIQLDHTYSLYESKVAEDSTKIFKFKRLAAFKDFASASLDERYKKDLQMSY